MEEKTIKFRELYFLNGGWEPDTELHLQWRCDAKPYQVMEAYDAKEMFGDEEVYFFDGRKVCFDLPYEERK